MLFIPSDLPFSRLGMVVGKKAAKKAVARNLIKRQVREVFRLHPPQVPMDLVVRAKKVILDADKKKARDELISLFSRMRACASS